MQPFMSSSERLSSPRRSLPGGLILDLDSEVNHQLASKSAQSPASELALDSRSHTLPLAWQDRQAQLTKMEQIIASSSAFVSDIERVA